MDKFLQLIPVNSKCPYPMFFLNSVALSLLDMPESMYASLVIFLFLEAF